MIWEVYPSMYIYFIERELHAGVLFHACRGACIVHMYSLAENTNYNAYVNFNPTQSQFNEMQIITTTTLKAKVIINNPINIIFSLACIWHRMNTTFHSTLNVIEVQQASTIIAIPTSIRAKSFWVS